MQDAGPVWVRVRRPWGRADAVALMAWTAAVAGFFRDVVGLRRALFYFDISEINYPYRAFLARELRAGRFSRWCPDLYCGLPLYSESQAGYLHPWKYLLYPWLPTWQALNLDTVLSVWLAGLAAYGWLRRHVGATGALTGAAVFGLGGFTWAHLVHTSWVNALAATPLVFWALESGWERRSGLPLVLGAAAMASQVFAGQVQSAILTGLAALLYGVHRAATERGLWPRARGLGTAVGLVALAGLLSAVQWVPSKELLDRSPRAGGLTWAEQTYGSWHPELLPTLIFREVYGTRARATDWMDAFYPYHEMDVYVGVLGLSLALIGASAYRDRWLGFWVALAGAGAVLMLGKYTFLFDRMNRLPVVGSARIPVRYHLWVTLGVAALAAVGADRLARPGRVGTRGAARGMLFLTLAALAVALNAYAPALGGSGRETSSFARTRNLWLADELTWAAARSAALTALGWLAIVGAARAERPAFRRGLAGFLPLLVLAELLGAHWRDVPTVPPSYWTTPPASAGALASDPSLVRIAGFAGPMANARGFASMPVDFFAARDTLAWNLAPAWGLHSSTGETPIYPRRLLRYNDHARFGRGRYDVEGVTHLLTGGTAVPGLGPPRRAGSALIYRNPGAQPRARLMGRPAYAADERDAARVVSELGAAVRRRVVVEDPGRPLPADAVATGTATIVHDEPERVAVETDSPSPAYLVLADTFVPGWSATLDGRPASIRPAFVAFRAVYVPGGRHRAVFRYRPAGFRAGLIASTVGLALAVAVLAWSRRPPPAEPPHEVPDLPRSWPWWGLLAAAVVLSGSIVGAGPAGRLHVQNRWAGSPNHFSWGAGNSR